MTTLARRNGRTAAIAALAVIFMVGLAFASVPLYRLFCQVTGFAGIVIGRCEYLFGCTQYGLCPPADGSKLHAAR